MLFVIVVPQHQVSFLDYKSLIALLNEVSNKWMALNTQRHSLGFWIYRLPNMALKYTPFESKY